MQYNNIPVYQFKTFVAGENIEKVIGGQSE